MRDISPSIRSLLKRQDQFFRGKFRNHETRKLAAAESRAFGSLAARRSALSMSSTKGRPPWLRLYRRAPSCSASAARFKLCAGGALRERQRFRVLWFSKGDPRRRPPASAPGAAVSSRGRRL